MQSLKIVQVAHAYPPYVGGLSHVVYMLSTMLAKKYQVEVVTLDPSGKNRTFETVNGVTIRRFGCLSPSNAYFLPSPGFFSYLGSLKADIVHVHNIASLSTPISFFAVRNSHSRSYMVVSPHHHIAGSLRQTKMLWVPYKPLAGAVLRRTNAVHCVSEYEASKVLSDFGVEPVIVENGVDDWIYKYSWRDSSKDRITVISVGRLEKYKRVDMIIRAAAIVKSFGVEVTVNVIGEGPELDRLVNYAKRLGVQLTVFHNLPRDQLFQMYCESSCMVNCSQYEAFSLVTAEALAIGLPSVIVKPWGEIFRQYPRAAIVRPEPQSVAEGMMRCQELGRLPSKHVSTWEEVSEKICSKVYDLPSRPVHPLEL